MSSTRTERELFKQGTAVVENLSFTTGSMLNGRARKNSLPHFTQIPIYKTSVQPFCLTGATKQGSEASQGDLKCQSHPHSTQVTLGTPQGELPAGEPRPGIPAPASLPGFPHFKGYHHHQVYRCTWEGSIQRPPFSPALPS